MTKKVRFLVYVFYTLKYFSVKSFSSISQENIQEFIFLYSSRGFLDIKIVKHLPRQ